MKHFLLFLTCLLAAKPVCLPNQGKIIITPEMPQGVNCSNPSNPLSGGNGMGNTQNVECITKMGGPGYGGPMVNDCGSGVPGMPQGNFAPPIQRTPNQPVQLVPMTMMPVPMTQGVPPQEQQQKPCMSTEIVMCDNQQEMPPGTPINTPLQTVTEIFSQPPPNTTIIGPPQQYQPAPPQNGMIVPPGSMIVPPNAVVPPTMCGDNSGMGGGSPGVCMTGQGMPGQMSPMQGMPSSCMPGGSMNGSGSGQPGIQVNCSSGGSMNGGGSYPSISGGCSSGGSMNGGGSYPSISGGCSSGGGMNGSGSYPSISGGCSSGGSMNGSGSYPSISGGCSSGGGSFPQGIDPGLLAYSSPCGSGQGMNGSGDYSSSPCELVGGMGGGMNGGMSGGCSSPGQATNQLVNTASSIASNGGCGMQGLMNSGCMGGVSNENLRSGNGGNGMVVSGGNQGVTCGLKDTNKLLMNEMSRSSVVGACEISSCAPSRMPDLVNLNGVLTPTTESYAQSSKMPGCSSGASSICK